MTREELEKKVENLVEYYGGYVDEIEDFLFESGHLDVIIDLVKELDDNE